MGLAIDRLDFDEEDHRRFDERLRASLAALRAVLAEPGFGGGPVTIGAELELDLVDPAGRPLPVNTEVLAACGDPRLTLEVDRFNLEINADPVPLAGRPFSALGDGLGSTLVATRRAAAGFGGDVVAIGILPTLTEADLQSGALTAGLRYQALSRGLLRLRQQPFPLRIEGDDSVELTAPDVTFEGANTSFQLHLKCTPAAFAATYNAAQLAVGPALAVAGNAPLFLGRRLWDETRIALFRQSVDDRTDSASDDLRPARVSFGHGYVRQGAWELFAEAVAQHRPLLPVLGPEDPAAALRAGRAPALDELRLHQGTVWRWNRAIYDAAGGSSGAHVRVELRALPAGPSLPDMMANAAFQLGLVLGLAPDMDAWLAGMPFTHARANFYAAARHGLRATLWWPQAPGALVRPVRAAALVEELLPIAERGLITAGVDADEARAHLDVVAARAQVGQTGAVVLRRWWDALVPKGAGERTRDPDPAGRVTRAYLACQHTGLPVHRWDPAALG